MIKSLRKKCGYYFMMTDPVKHHLLTLDVAAPRYTSYPPATAFTADFSEKTYKSWLKTITSADPVSLYVHIPFCEKLCYYCGCFTTISAKEERLERYVDDLVRELEILHKELREPVSVSHLHFGGGSPTILKPALLTRLMTEIRSYFTILPDAEIAIEADPRQMSEARIATFAANGMTRVSLGMQDINQDVLKIVNRPQPFYLSHDAVHLCRDYGIQHINLDLMYGLPKQTVMSISRTIETALTLKPDRIAFFGYAHVPWMKKHMRVISDIDIPDASLRYDLYEAGREILGSAGYLPVGIDHFVRPSDTMAQALGNRTLHRNFQGYTTDSAARLIGLGASSIGKFPEGYVQNIADLRLYHEKIDQGLLPINKGYMLHDQDRIYGVIISELMCYMAVDLTQIAARFHQEAGYFQDNLARLEPLQHSGLVSIDGSFVRVHHPHAARLAARCFDPMINDVPLQNRHSRAV